MNTLELVEDIKNHSLIMEYHNLSSATWQEKMLYLYGLSIMMNIDNEINQKELDLLEIFINSFEIQLDSKELIEFSKNPQEETVKEIMEFIKDFRLNKVFLFDCLLMLKIDNKEMEPEKKLLKFFGEQSRISPKDIKSLAFLLDYLLFFVENNLNLNFKQTIAYIFAQLNEVEFGKRIMYFEDGTLKYIGGETKGYIFSINEETDYFSYDFYRTPIFYKGEIIFEEQHKILTPIPEGHGYFYYDKVYFECKENSRDYFDQKECKIQLYHFNGQLCSSFELKNMTTITSKQIKIFNSEGNLVYDGDYFDIDGEGKGILYYTNGSIFYKGEFKDGQFYCGRVYRENGELYFKGVFQDGLPSGEPVDRDCQLEIRLIQDISQSGPSFLESSFLNIKRVTNEVMNEQRCIFFDKAITTLQQVLNKGS